MQDDAGNQYNAGSTTGSEAIEKASKPKPKLKYLIAIVAVAAAIAAIILLPGQLLKQKSSSASAYVTSIYPSTYATTTIASANTKPSNTTTVQNKTKAAPSGIAAANISKGQALPLSKFAEYVESIGTPAYANITSLNATYAVATHVKITTNSTSSYYNYSSNVSIIKNGTDSMVKAISGNSMSYIFFLNGREYSYSIINGNTSQAMCINSTANSVPSEALLSSLFEVPYLGLNSNATSVTILDIKNSTYKTFPCEYINASISGLNNTVAGIISLCISSDYSIPVYGYEAIGLKKNNSSISQGGKQYEILSINATANINNTGISAVSSPIKAMLPAPLSICVKAS